MPHHDRAKVEQFGQPSHRAMRFLVACPRAEMEPEHAAGRLDAQSLAEIAEFARQPFAQTFRVVGVAEGAELQIDAAAVDDFGQWPRWCRKGR